MTDDLESLRLAIKRGYQRIADELDRLDEKSEAIVTTDSHSLVGATWQIHWNKDTGWRVSRNVAGELSVVARRRVFYGEEVESLVEQLRNGDTAGWEFVGPHLEPEE